MTHPLTDEVCRQIADTKDRPFTSIEMDNLRAATDWQLEQVIKFILKEDMVYYDDPVLLARYIKKAMRPTQENNQ